MFTFKKFKKLKTLKTLEITFMMKSGKDIVVYADKIDIETKSGNDLSGYKMTGLAGSVSSLYIRIDDVSAITTSEVWKMFVRRK
jgi:hypothetical protein